MYYRIYNITDNEVYEVATIASLWEEIDCWLRNKEFKIETVKE